MTKCMNRNKIFRTMETWTFLWYQPLNIMIILELRYLHGVCMGMNISWTCINVTIINIRQKVYCHYYDSIKNTIGKPFQSHVFPNTVIYCLRRAGAKFVALTKNTNDWQQYPIPLINRIKIGTFSIKVLMTRSFHNSYFDKSDFGIFGLLDFEILIPIFSIVKFRHPYDQNSFHNYL